MLAFLALQAVPIFFAHLSGTPPFPLPVLGFPLLIVRKAVCGKGLEGQEKVRAGCQREAFYRNHSRRAEEGTRDWLDTVDRPRTALNPPLGKTLLSVRSRSTSLPPESEEWELWGVAVPRGEEHSLNARASLLSHCLQISGTQSTPHTLEKGGCGRGRTLTCNGDFRATGGGRSRAVGTAVVGAGLAAIIQ